MKKKIKIIILRILSKDYTNFKNLLNIKSALQYFLFQKILRINSHCPWPVHWSSYVGSINNIKFSREITPLGYSQNAYIQTKNGIEIGSNVIHAVGLTIITSNHELNSYTESTENGPVIIEDNCWLGANVTILPSVKLGNHTIVSAGSVVTKSFTKGNCIIGGVPAKIIREIDSYNGNHYFTDEYIKNNVIVERK